MNSSDTAGTSRFARHDLLRFAQDLLVATGMATDKAEAVAQSLVRADAMGHHTHGLALMPLYLGQIKAGSMALDGDWQIVNDRGGCITIDGRRLPGAWLIERAIDLALARIASHGVVTIAIANSHHNGALAVYLPRLTEQGLIVQLQSSSPGAKGIAPFGGSQALLTPNPVAAGYPTQGEPVLIDISSSITTLNNARQLAARGERFPAPWAMDALGNPTDDPAVVAQGQGSLLPVGGVDHGHKGYAMGLLTEALTQGLSGWGRADAQSGMSLCVLLQVTDPQAFAGLDAFTRQTQWTADACRSNPPRPGGAAVRLPGQKALASERMVDEQGVALLPAVVEALQAAAVQAGVATPLLHRR